MHRAELRDEFIQAALTGGHGSAMSVMLALDAGELAAAATPGDGDGQELANFWYLPGDFTRAIGDADANSLIGEAILEQLATLALAYNVDSGEVMFRLAAERGAIDARGEEWNDLPPARRRAWELFALVANRVYSVLIEEARASEGVTRIGRVPALAETIFDEDKEGPIDEVRAAALKMMTAPAVAEPAPEPAAPEAEPAMLSAFNPPAAELPPEEPPAKAKSNGKKSAKAG
ncbi:hypothetical protein [Ancylobacter terrae]|uniref:hypothetical protein n=1 Tax=Ancylobacter sp. sgz301288 TaxID=3342077 RepID=UPI00385BA697